MATPDSFRFENLSPEDVSAVRGSISNLGLDPQFAMNAETFNKLPKDKREALFSQLGNIRLASAQPDVTVVRADSPGISEITIGNRVIRFDGQEGEQAAPVTDKGVSPQPPPRLSTEELETQLANYLAPRPSALDDISDMLMGPLKTAPLPDWAEELTVPSGSTIKQKAGQVGLGLAEGAVRYGTPAAAASLAFTSTLPLALASPGAQVIPFVAAAGAYGGGYFLGDTLADFFPAPPREDLVPYREGAITAGGILASAPTTLRLTAARRGMTPLSLISYLGVTSGPGARIYKLIEYSAQAASRNPKTYLGAEALTASAAGLAGGSADSVYPGEAGVRFASEFGASVFTPGRLLLNSATTGYYFLKNLVSKKFSASAVDTARANRLYSILDNVLKESAPIKELEELGTPDALAQAQVLRERYYKNLIRQLEADLPPDARPTAAQATGDPGLALLEESLSRGDASFRAKSADQAQSALRAQQALIAALSDIGDPVSLSFAAKMQADLYDSMILGRMRIAESTAAASVSRISLDTPENRGLVGTIIKNNVEEALEEARNYEKLLWRQAYQQGTKVQKGQIVPRQVVPKKTLTSFLEFASGITKERYKKLPDEVRSIMERLGVNETAIASYKRGMRTPEYLETGRVPDEYLIGGFRLGRDGKPIYQPLGNKTDVDELIRIRSDLLGWARDAASSTAQRSPSDARMFGMLAESILDDFSQLNTKAYDRARQFSRSLHDNFTRSYARDITAVTKAGAERTPPELLIGRMFGRDSDLTFARMEQVEDAVGFFGQQYDALTQQLAQLRAAKAPATQIGVVQQQLDAIRPMVELSQERVVSVTHAMDRVLRLAMTDPTIVNPQTRRVNAQALANWMTRNEATLNKFGSLKNDLKTALDAENAFAALDDPNSAVARQLRDQQDFSLVLAGGEKPTAAVSDVIASRTPITDLRRLINVANTSKTPQAALSGLKSSIFEWAYTKAGGTGNQFSVQAFDDNLFRPLAPGQPSIVNLLRTQGLMTSDEVKNIRRIFGAMRRIDDAKDNRVFIENVLAGGNPLEAFAVRFLALHGSSAAIPSGPGSLAAASAVSNTAQQLFNQMPRLNALAGLREAAADPKLMAALLRKGRTEQEKLAFLRNAQEQLRVAGILVPMSTGQRALIPALNITEQRQEDTQRRREEARRIRTTPPAPTTRGMPGMTPPAGGAPPAGGGGGAPPTSQSRMMLQQLFPNDAITGAAAMQGGAPPMPG